MVTGIPASLSMNIFLATKVGENIHGNKRPDKRL